jgi:hypothetical protein
VNGDIERISKAKITAALDKAARKVRKARGTKKQGYDKVQHGLSLLAVLDASGLGAKEALSSDVPFSLPLLSLLPIQNDDFGMETSLLRRTDATSYEHNFISFNNFCIQRYNLEIWRVRLVPPKRSACGGTWETSGPFGG